MLDFTWYAITRNAQQKDFDRLQSRIWQPPLGVLADERSPWSADAETAGLGALKSALSG